MADILAEAEVEANLEEGVVDDSVVVEEESDKVNEPQTEESNEEAAEEKEEVLPGKNLHVRNLSFKVTEEILREAFKVHGEILSVNIIKEPGSDKSRGFAFIGFANEDEGAAALAAMNGVELEGRAIKVEESHRKKGHSKTPGQYLGPKVKDSRPIGGGRFNDRDRRGADRRGGGGFRRSNSRDRFRGGGGYRGGGGSRSPPDRYRGGGGDRGGYRGDDRRGGYDNIDYRDRGPPPPADRWGGPRGGPPGGGAYRSRSRDRGPPPPPHGGYRQRSRSRDRGPPPRGGPPPPGDYGRGRY